MNAPQSEDYNNQGAKPWSRDYIYFCLILNSHSPSLRQGRASTTTVPLPANNAGRGSEAAVEVAERQRHRCRRRRLRRRAGGVGGGEEAET